MSKIKEKTQEVVAEKPKVQAKPIQKKVPHLEDDWEIKDRNYFLTGSSAPLTLTLKSRHTEKYPLLYFDPIKKEQRALRYATNQNSPFVDEQKGEVTLAHIMFKDGTLSVPKEYQTLQKLLSLYHPDVNKRFAEHKPQAIAQDELVDLEIQLMAMNAARDMDVDTAEAIMRVEIGSQVNEMSSKELKRDLMIFSKNNPRLFIDLAKDDNVQLRNFGIKAVEANIIKLSQDQRYFTWGSTDRKLLTIPFDENPYSALAAWFKTDEGVEVYKTIDKKIS
jgi:hypothetical protein|tara:strand:- start:1886 stop:2716 length:831 start_codon:yes stop_codon:yes gene_type:complete